MFRKPCNDVDLMAIFVGMSAEIRRVLRFGLIAAIFFCFAAILLFFLLSVAISASFGTAFESPVEFVSRVFLFSMMVTGDFLVERGLFREHAVVPILIIGLVVPWGSIGFATGCWYARKHKPEETPETHPTAHD